MRTRSLLMLVLIAVIGWLYFKHAQHDQVIPAPPAGSQTSTDTTPPVSGRGQGGCPVMPSFLSPEAVQTIKLIESGGPFPHGQDGTVFGNREGLLPSQARGFYHEYTVETPGADNRGARRIITGGTPPLIYYYTSDHYGSFRCFQVH